MNSGIYAKTTVEKGINNIKRIQSSNRAFTLPVWWKKNIIVIKTSAVLIHLPIYSEKDLIRNLDVGYTYRPFKGHTSKARTNKRK